MRRLLSIVPRASRWLPALGLVAVVLALTGQLSRTAPGYDDRTLVGRAWREHGFTIAAVWPPRDQPSFVEGARLAWEAIEAGGSPLAGRIRLRVFEEPATEKEGGLAARIARDGSVLAVLGHAIPEHVVPASLVYQRYGILFLTPQGTDPRSTGHDFDYVFRLTPDDGQIADALARYAGSNGLARVGMVYARTAHGESASRQFAARAVRHGVRVAFSRSYHYRSSDWNNHDFRPLAAEIRRHEIDAIVLADELPFGGKLVQDLVRMGFTKPILGTDKLDSPRLWEIAGPSARNVFVASTFEPGTSTPDYLAFRERFGKRYGGEPGAAVVQGYEAFMLAAQACLASQDAAPLVLANTIRLAASWPGLDGPFSFTPGGDVVGRRISIKRAEAGGRFETVYFWEANQE